MAAFLLDDMKDEPEELVTMRIRPPVCLEPAGPCAPLEAAARVYHDFQRQPGNDAELLTNLLHNYPGRQEHVHLFRSLHEQDPDAADRLARALIGMPAVGADFLGFRLLSELGRGAFGRVFLARQGQLADRHVVLKVAADVRGEVQALAQLQHPNIVPIYSAHRHDPFQVVCMPFQGSTTFQDVLRRVEAQEKLPTSGKVLSPYLASFSYVEAIVWLGARLADGLAHAHVHGIIHRDLKPANILLTDDGQPMLLDFNVAADTKLASGGMIDRAAGTLPYMAPEQLAAFEGKDSAIDGRCDIFGFGVVLFELLTGRFPFTRPGDRQAAPPRLRRLNAAVTPALEAIVRRCLEPDLARRYQSARELQEDLERQGTHRPLRYTAEPSRRERLQKLVRRHPRLVAGSLVAAVGAVLLTALAGLALVRGRQVEELRVQEAERLRQEQQQTEALDAFHRFEEGLKTCQFLLYTHLPEPDQLAAGVALGERIVERYRVVRSSSWRETALVAALPAEQQQQLANGMGELLLLLARAELMRHGATRTGEQGPRHAYGLNERAAECSVDAAQAPALWQQRAALALAMGQKEAAARFRQKAESLPRRTAQDYYWLASEHIAAGRLRQALPLARQAAYLEPQNFWAWFIQAHCHERLGADARAESSYAACIALWPKFHWAYFNRGLTFMRQKEYRLACADFDKVIALQPKLTDGYVNRALARQGLGEYQKAEEDLTEAIQRGDSATRLYFLRSRVRAGRGDKEGAKRDYKEGLRREPTDEKSWLARGFANLARDPRAALADFEQALHLNPRSAAGLQNKAHVLAERLGRNQEALDVLNRAVTLYPDSVPARGGRGVILARLGQRAPAVQDARETLLRDAAPPRLYQVACIYALTSKQAADDRHRAFELLSSALRQGYGLDLLETDHDLDPIRHSAEFRRLVDGTRALRGGKKE